MNQITAKLPDREVVRTQSDRLLTSDNKILHRIEEIAASIETGEDLEEAGCLHYIVKNLMGNRTLDSDRNLIQIDNKILHSTEILPKLMQYRMLPQLVKETIIDLAISEIECTPEELKLARQQFLQQYQITTKSGIISWCEQNYLSYDELDSMLLRHRKIEKFKQARWSEQVEPFFIAHKKDLDRVCFSLIRLQNKALAQEIYFRLTEKEQTFAELARQYSLGSEAQTAGIIGPVPLDRVHPTIARMLKRVEPGKILPPAQVQEWIAIVRLETFISAQLDEQIKKELLDKLFSQWLDKKMRELPIDLFPKVLTS